MSSAKIYRPRKSQLLVLAGLAASVFLLGTSCPINPGLPFDHTASTYVGSETCGVCHADIYAQFMNHGHSYKLNKVENNQVPTYPFSTIAPALAMLADSDDADAADPGVGTDNALGTPASYADISYVIGGFGWKARFIDLDGYIVTGDAVQYNLETGGMAGYHNNEQDKKYNCGNCHTTGWKAFTDVAGDDRNDNRQDNRPGMAGTFTEPGVGCEACHGAGSAHVAGLGDRSKITRHATARATADFLKDNMAFGMAVACSECHTRTGEKDYPDYVSGDNTISAKGGLIKHREQYDEMLGINPDDVAAGPTGPHQSLDCIDCHNPHTTTKYEATSGDPPGHNTECTSCHAGYAIKGPSLMTNLGCKDCHMPLLAKSAVAHASAGNGPTTGDMRSHIFRIDLSKTDQFTADGSKAYPWITATWACLTCHNDDPNSGSTLDLTNVDLTGRTIHNN